MEPNTTIQICVILPDELRFITVEPDLPTLQALVGGYLETYPLRASTHVYFNEDGNAQGLPLNDLANKILPLMQSKVILLEGIQHDAPPFPPIVGPVLVIGSQEPNGQPDGEEHSLSRRSSLDLILGWLGRPLVGDKL